MKQVMIDTVKARIAEMENIQNTTTIGISLREEFELACLRQLMAAMDSEPVSQNEPISFDEWSRKCALQITLCYPDFREKAQYIWDSARETQQLAPAPVVSADLLHTAASAIEDLLTTKDRTGAGVWFDLPFRLRSAANAQPATVVPDEIYARTAFEAWYKTKYAFQGYEFEITDSGTYVWDNVNHMWNGYRAAMLNQAQEPATDNTAQQFEALATSAGSGKQPDSELEKAKRCLPYHLDDRYKVNGSWIGSVQNYIVTLEQKLKENGIDIDGDDDE